MHDYAIINHNRASVGRWLGVASLLLSYLISLGLLKLAKISFFENSFNFTVSTGILYWLVYTFFNKFLWKIPLFKLPNIQGVWSINGKTIDQNGQTLYEWSGELDIEQAWDKIAIVLKTDQSESKSYTATLRKESGSKGGWILYYSYKNEPDINEQGSLSMHKGYCEITFNENNETASGSYFNNFGRYTFGVLDLKKNK
ncbi:pancortin-3 [Ignatzschineria sp. RMDPL8A]|uniref:Cap15 family cyclic dinucleotide receptor domain-containing protein n=1 Tax=Ignatzschineria sp. RMDPL8A TaxID=2999236 RepID=UPI0024467D49|nr:hypothetical protein [Ignatzschineria sp. RMDPL8A]MDG9730337.1 pancortin-3 [Ignatzschineria sp. RMDPL8A]